MADAPQLRRPERDVTLRDACWTAAFAVVMVTIAQTVAMVAPQTQRAVAPGDPRFGEVYVEHATVPEWMLLIVALVLPAGIAFAVGIRSRLRRNKFGKAAFAAACVCLSVALAMCATDLVKLYVGYPRPHFFARAALGKDAERRARMSFPSGHSSSSFAGMLFLSLFLNGEFDLGTSGLPGVPALLGQLVAVLSPVCLALFVAVSRVHDNHHFPADVVSGACIGSGCAIATFFSLFTRATGASAGTARAQQSFKPATYASSEDIHDDGRDMAIHHELSDGPLL